MKTDFKILVRPSLENFKPLCKIGRSSDQSHPIKLFQHGILLVIKCFGNSLIRLIFFSKVLLAFLNELILEGMSPLFSPLLSLKHYHFVVHWYINATKKHCAMFKNHAFMVKTEFIYTYTTYF